MLRGTHHAKLLRWKTSQKNRLCMCRLSQTSPGQRLVCSICKITASHAGKPECNLTGGPYTSSSSRSSSPRYHCSSKPGMLSSSKSGLLCWLEGKPICTVLPLRDLGTGGAPALRRLAKLRSLLERKSRLCGRKTRAPPFLALDLQCKHTSRFLAFPAARQLEATSVGGEAEVLLAVDNLLATVKRSRKATEASPPGRRTAFCPYRWPRAVLVQLKYCSKSGR